MKTLITGGAGFLGSHLVDVLLKRDRDVLVFDNLITGRPDNIARHLGDARFQFVKQDVTEYLFAAGEIDSVVHFASPASPIDYLQFPIQTLKVGSLGTHKALGLAKEKKAKFLLASTSEVYGDPQIHPQPEDYWGHVNPVGPRGVYDEAKRFAEAITMAYHRYHGLDTRIVRIFNTYGGRMRPNDGRVVSNFIVQALKGEPLTIYGDGSQTRSFCYVTDLIAGIVKLLEAPELEEDNSTGTLDLPSRLTANVHYPINIGNPQEFTVLELAEKVLRITGSRSRIEYRPLPVDDPRVRRPDISRARRLLGWEPAVSLEEGLAETIHYFRKVI
ncbi:MAG: UDP-glucuronic acid decarboxylase family protein [Blastocatellia bacterium]